MSLADIWGEVAGGEKPKAKPAWQVVEDRGLAWFLKQELEKSWPAKRKVPPPHKDTLFRVSGLYRICPRQEVLKARHQVWTEDSVGFDLSWIFGIGTGFHEFLQSDLFWPLAVGRWRCPLCQWVTPLEGRKPGVCEQCGCEQLRYVERFVKSVEWGVQGHPDQLWDWPGKGRGIPEIKTINQWGFEEVKRSGPKPEHIQQVQVYMYLMNVDQGWIVYIGKGDISSFESAVHVVHVLRDERIIHQELSKVQEFRRHLAAGTLPEKQCKGRVQSRTRQEWGCAVSLQCQQAA